MSLTVECRYCKFKGTQTEDLFSSDHVCEKYDAEVWMPEEIEIKIEKKSIEKISPDKGASNSQIQIADANVTCFEQPKGDIMVRNSRNKRSLQKAKPKMKEMRKRGRKPK